MTEQTTPMDHSDLRARVAALEHASTGKETRLSTLEQWKSQRDVADAVRDVQYAGIKEDLSSIKGTLQRLAWLMITGIAGGVIAFMINGGFKVP